MFYSKKIKDIKTRKKILQREHIYKLNKFLKLNLLNFFYKFDKFKYKKILYIFLQKKNIKSYKTKLSRRCVINNRSRSVFRLFSISRLALKNLLSFGIVPGFRKAIW